MTSYPTPAQEKALAYAPIPFAIISFFTSCYLVYFIMYKHREKLERLYHRLVLALNFALIPSSLILAFGRFAVPEGTPLYPEAVGTTQSCTVIGFLNMVFAMTVPTYYASLSLQAYMGIKNNFKEAKYRWIEKWVHIIAYCFPAALASVFAATGNMNPHLNGAGCRVYAYPWDCKDDPDMACRGKDLSSLMLILGPLLIIYYFVFPPAIVIAMYCWTGRLNKKNETGVGMQKIRESHRRKLMRSIARQSCVYLFSFWSTWAPLLIGQLYRIMTGEILYGLFILGHCMFAAQGFIFGVVYFMLQWLGKPRVDVATTRAGSSTRKNKNITVGDIRSNVENRDESEVQDSTHVNQSIGTFNIFDGVPDPDSPWAKYLCCEDEIETSSVENPTATD